MSRQELSIEIQTLLKEMPEETLESVLKYLKNLNSSQPDEIKSFQALNKILKEDSDLLKRLAQ